MGEQPVPSDGGRPPRRKSAWVAALLAVAVLGSTAFAGWAVLLAIGLPVNPWDPRRCGAETAAELASSVEALKRDLPALEVEYYDPGDCFFDAEAHAGWTYPTLEALTADAAKAGCSWGNPDYQSSDKVLTCLVAEERLEFYLDEPDGVEVAGIVGFG